MMRKRNENIIAEIRKEIQLCLSSKRRILAEIILLNERLNNSEISHHDHSKELSKLYYGRTHDEWLKFCDEKTSSLNKEIEFHESKLKEERARQNLAPVALLVFVLIAAGLFFFKPSLTGYAAITAEQNYTQTLDMAVDSYSEQAWFLEHPGSLH